MSRILSDLLAVSTRYPRQFIGLHAPSVCFSGHVRAVLDIVNFSIVTTRRRLSHSQRRNSSKKLPQTSKTNVIRAGNMTRPETRIRLRFFA